MRKLIMMFLILVTGIGSAHAKSLATDKDPKLLIESRHKMFHKILNDSPKKNAGQIRKEIRGVLSSFVDFDAVARLALKRHFEDLTPTQKARYTESFKRLIQSSYLKRLKLGTRYEMSVLGEPELRNGKARVRTLLKSGVCEFEVDYLLIQYLDDTWRSYDIVIDGVSMVRNYRKGLYDLMKKQGFEAMMDKIDKKVKEREWWVSQ
jgi:phospholipid transport system substrate-binding protein